MGLKRDYLLPKSLLLHQISCGLLNVYVGNHHRPWLVNRHESNYLCESFQERQPHHNEHLSKKFQNLLAILEKSMDGYVCPQHQQNTRLTQSNLVILSLFVRNIDEWLDQFYLLYPLDIHFCFSSVSLHYFNKCFFS